MKQTKRIERLDKVLSNHGYGSRKDVRGLIRSGAVYVDGELATDFDAHVDLDLVRIVVDGVELVLCEHVYLMMNKPGNVVCSAKEGGHQTVFDLLDPAELHQYLGGEIGMVGRLDLDTEGLLLLTTDGQLNHFLTSPRNRIPKTYLVGLAKDVTPDEQAVYTSKLAAGVHIAAEGHEEEADCLPAECVWDSDAVKEAQASAGGTSAGGLGSNAPQGDAARFCTLTVYEGKYHEVKRLFAALGNTVVFLKRLSLGGLALDPSLAPGEYRPLSAEEISLLRK